MDIGYRRKVRSALIDLAKEGEPMSYLAFSDRFQLGFKTGNKGLMKKLADALDYVSRYEFRHERPMLSVMVQNKEYMKPGSGFFAMWREENQHDEERIKLRDQDLYPILQKDCVEYWRNEEKYIKFKDDFE